MKSINLNADLGESFGTYTIGDDKRLFGSITSANIACGFHAGDPLVMQKTVQVSKDKGVSIGAHPSFPDLQGFGRRVMQMSLDEVYAMVTYQIGSLMGIARSQGMKVTHVKPHGALNNMACEDAMLAEAICQATKDVDNNLIFLAPALSELSSEAKKSGLRTAEEIFADRAYTDKGTLVPRSQPGAVIDDVDECLKRILDMLDQGGIITRAGNVLPTPIHSICVHGDTSSACENAEKLKSGLIANGYDLLTLDQMNL